MAAENETAAPWKLPYPSSTGEVKLGAQDFAELAERATAIFKERYLTLAEHGASFTAKSGELVKATAAITATLPAAAVNAIVGVLANGHEVTVGAGAAVIYGDFVTGSTPIKLVGYQHVILVSDGTNWFIVAGEPRNEATYGGSISHASEEEVEPSASRGAQVTLTFRIGSNGFSGWKLTVGGAVAAERSGRGAEGVEEEVFSFFCPAGQKWKVKLGADVESLHSRTLLR
jgi:hypothetical protein